MQKSLKGGKQSQSVPLKKLWFKELSPEIHIKGNIQGQSAWSKSCLLNSPSSNTPGLKKIPQKITKPIQQKHKMTLRTNVMDSIFVPKSEQIFSILPLRNR